MKFFFNSRKILTLPVFILCAGGASAVYYDPNTAPVQIDTKSNTVLSPQNQPQQNQQEPQEQLQQEPQEQLQQEPQEQLQQEPQEQLRQEPQQQEQAAPKVVNSDENSDDYKKYLEDGIKRSRTPQELEKFVCSELIKALSKDKKNCDMAIDRLLPHVQDINLLIIIMNCSMVYENYSRVLFVISKIYFKLSSDQRTFVRQLVQQDEKIKPFLETIQRYAPDNAVSNSPKKHRDGSSRSRKHRSSRGTNTDNEDNDAKNNIVPENIAQEN